MQPETFMPLPGPQPERREKTWFFLAHFGLGDCTEDEDDGREVVQEQPGGCSK